MAEMYKLPGSSYEGIVKIILAYSSEYKNGDAVALTELSESSGIDRTIISRNNAFLTQIKLITAGRKKAPTKMGLKLGEAYQKQIGDQVAEIWNEIVHHDEFLSRMLSLVQTKGEIAKSDFVDYIVISSGNKVNSSIKAGAAAVIEILKLTNLLREENGKICVWNGWGKKTKNSPEQIYEKIEKTSKEVEQMPREILMPESGYYVQSYTCESGKAAKLVIPEGATRDDLLAFYDMLNIVLKRKFKIDFAE